MYISSSKYQRLAISLAISPTLLIPVNLNAQALEEIVVTAQRREQSIQEVPISLEAYSGNELLREGFRTMEDLSSFSPSVEIDVRVQDQDVSIRGLGTTGNNLGLEQAVPTFVDGIHYGRTSMIMGAFLDLERVEVLRGPQPIAFGQNATAGAFSLTTRKPGPEWEGDVTAEYGNFGLVSVEGGVGGPITETLGIRVAGQHDRMRGYIRDVVTEEMFPNSQESAARLTLQWQPAENFEAIMKGEWASRRRDGDGNAVCLKAIGQERLTERAVTLPGLTDFDEIVDVLPFPDDCDDSSGMKRVGVQEGHAPFFKPIDGIDQEDGRGGIVDITTIKDLMHANPHTHDNMDAYSYRLGLNYQFNNGISVDSNTGYIDYQRASNYDNSSSPIITNWQQRGEIFDMFSQELRLLSPRGGTLEWEAGAFYQQEDLDLGNIGRRNKYMTASTRANIRRPFRTQNNWQDTEWMSAFGAITFNFLDDQASLDVGARYTDINKQSFIQGYAATLIFDIDPDSADANPGDGIITGTWHDRGDQQRDVTDSIIDCASGHPQCGDYGAGFWTHEWRERTVPDSWDTQSPVDYGPILFGIRRARSNVIYFRDYNDSSLDPQVTLRYRPSENLSLYAKWARAFKGGGADISSGSLPSGEQEFLLEAEHAENFEVGAKGSLAGGMANYSVTAFQITIDDLQIATNRPTELGSGSFSTNAGKQRTRGIEFEALWAATDRLRLGFSGALMDGEMVEYVGAGCTDFEFENADTGPCLSEEESEELYNTDEFEGTIDRSGYDAPRTPDWKVVVDADYWMPITAGLKALFSSKVALHDSYILNVEDFDEVLKYDDRVVINLNAGIGDINDTWNLNLWVRNLLSHGVKYFPEFDVDEDRARIDWSVSPRNFTTYGIQFQYNYN